MQPSDERRGYGLKVLSETRHKEMTTELVKDRTSCVQYEYSVLDGRVKGEHPCITGGRTVILAWPGKVHFPLVTLREKR